jgi:lipoyl-dependent peroxiredoxin
LPATSSTARLLYTARVQTSGGREKGVARSADGRLDVRLSVPGESGLGTNPEQLLAAAWSACFASALALEARRARIELPPDASIDAEVDLNVAGGAGYFLRARLAVSLPGLDRAVARKLIDTAQRTCPYCKAMHGNVEIDIILV